MNSFSRKLIAFSDLIRLRKQYGTGLLILPAMWSLFIASGGRPSIELIIIFTLGAFLMRSAGCAVNDIADRNLDGLVERTSNRPLPEGRIKVWEAVLVFTSLSALAFLLVLTLNKLTILLSFVAVIMAVAYPFVKRVSFFPQAFLGAAFGWGAVMAWSAVTGTVSLVAVLIFLANIFFSMAYDTIYALMDIEDDKKAGVKSTAIFFEKKVYGTVIIFYFFMFLILGLAGWLTGDGIFYYLFLLGAFFFSIIKVMNLKSFAEEKNSVKTSEYKLVVLKTFTSNVWTGFVILIGIIIELNL
ncbi:MAG: 4-hydroxybenzoate octaprenyltransferase [Deltaproteobacteria bacterium]|nr:4-hydroxybenzoate octaprenyltransferase [Deltaproteobacteria bacterium]